ncbi:MAG: hypothetical protein WKF75_17470 [Singulisphaera sp.]
MLPHRSSPGRGRQGSPRPREELLHLSPLDRVLAQLDALDLDYQAIDPGYAARCPFHVSDPGRLNSRSSKSTATGSPRRGLLPAGTVLLHHAYGDLTGPEPARRTTSSPRWGSGPVTCTPDGATPVRDDLRAGRRSETRSRVPPGRP